MVVGSGGVERLDRSWSDDDSNDWDDGLVDVSCLEALCNGKGVGSPLVVHFAFHQSYLLHAL